MKAKILTKGLVTHKLAQCKGEWCVLHNPSRHKMREWPIFIRTDRGGLAERVCEHGIGHPDPDSVAYYKRLGTNTKLDARTSVGKRLAAFRAGNSSQEYFSLHACDGCEYK